MYIYTHAHNVDTYTRMLFTYQRAPLKSVNAKLQEVLAVLSLETQTDVVCAPACCTRTALASHAHVYMDMCEFELAARRQIQWLRLFWSLKIT